MSEEKLSSDEVPEKFMEWLFSMGCPQEKVPSIDKISQMCRGQYYMVWRSLMEHVYPKDIIKQKRLQVFCNDVKNCQKKYVYNKIDTPTVPEEVLLWRQQTELKAKVAEAEQRVNAGRQNLHELMDKISNKVVKRNLARKQVENLQRRVWLLTQVTEELKTKRTNLQEIKAIAESLCTLRNDDAEVQSKVDKFLSSFERTSSPRRNMNASMSTTERTPKQPDNCDEEHLNSILQCSSEAVWLQLLDRRKAIAAKLAEYNAEPVAKHSSNSVTPQAVLSNTIALQCTLALEAMKNRARTENARNKLSSALKELNIILVNEPDACELLVLQFELAEATARTEAMKRTCEELVAGAGVFEVTGERIEEEAADSSDKSLENQKEELKRLVSALSITERKIQNVRDNLIAVFNAFYKDTPLTEKEKYTGVQLDLPLESIASLRKFYEDRREKKSKKMELSLNFDISDISFNDNTDYMNLSFADELRMYMKNFNLEKNRKLVLESGDQIWISETMSSALERYYKRLVDENAVSLLLNPTQSITSNLREILDELQTMADLKERVHKARSEIQLDFNIDINARKEEEEKLIDKIKKSLSDDLQNLHNTGKMLDMGNQNLKFWADNVAKNYISAERKVNGQTYKTVEALYLESLC